MFVPETSACWERLFYQDIIYRKNMHYKPIWLWRKYELWRIYSCHFADNIYNAIIMLKSYRPYTLKSNFL